MKRLFFRFAFTALLLTAILSADGARAQTANAPPIQESVFLETDPAAAKKLGALKEYLRDQQWTEAIQLAEQILEQHREKLIPTDPGRYVNLQTRCQSLLATMSAEGRNELRSRIDPLAEQWYTEGLQNRDAAPLRKIVKRLFLSSRGDDALAALGEIAFERGAYGEARGYWEMILPQDPPAGLDDPQTVLNYPDSDLNLAEIRARLVLCSLFQGDLLRFKNELEAFQKIHREARGRLAGRDGPLAELLTELSQEITAGIAAGLQEETTTFAGNPQRNAVYADAIDDIGAVQWTIPLKPPAAPGMPPGLELVKPAQLSHFPVVQGDVLFLNDETTISAYNLTTGKPAWGDPSGNDAVIYRALSPIDLTRGANRSRSGVPRYTMTIAEGRLYARMGSPITGHANANALTQSESHLVCLDIAQSEGKTVWKLEANAFAAPKEYWEFEGAPLVADGKLYVAMRKSTQQPQIRVICVDAEDGRLIWQQNVCTFLPAQAEDADQVSHQLLTLGEGTLFYSTDQGAIAAIEAQDGSLRWVVTYERAPQSPWSTQIKNGLVPCLYYQGNVIVAPADLRQNVAARRGGPRDEIELIWRSPPRGVVMAIDAKTGLIKWQTNLHGGVQHLLGAAENRLIVSGDKLWGLDLETGRIVWRRGHEDGESHGYGRGLLAENLVFWPHREAVWIFNIKTGEPHAEIPLGQWRTDIGPRLTGGNLLFAGRMMLIAQADSLVAYSQWGRLRKQLQEEISATPQDLQLHQRLAQVEHDSGNYRAAITQYRRLITLTEAGESDMLPIRAWAERQLRQTLISSAQSAQEAGDLEVAAEQYEEAWTLSPENAERLTIIQGLAATQLEMRQPIAAFHTWQKVLDSEELSRQAIKTPDGLSRNAADVATAEMRDLFNQEPAAFEETLESHVQEELQNLSAATPSGELLTLLKRLPVSTTIALKLLESFNRQGSVSAKSETEAALICLLKHHAAEVRKLALEKLAQLSEQQSHFHEAKRYWRKLAEDFPQAHLTDTASETTVAEYVQTHLQAPQFLEQTVLDHPDQADVPLRRRWSLTINSNRDLIIPWGVAPAIDEQVCFIKDDRLRCFNLAHGVELWSAALSEDFQWAGYVGSNVLLLGPSGIETVDLTTGQRVWRRTVESLLDEIENPSIENQRPNLEDTPRVFFDGMAPLACVRVGPELVCLQLWDGAVKWRFHPPQGFLQPHWLYSAGRCYLQTRAPDRVIALDSLSGATLAQLVGPSSSWPIDPVPLGDQGDFLMLTYGAEGALGCFARNGQLRWRFPRFLSQTNTPPALLICGDALAVVEDGDTLLRIDSQSGRQLWGEGLGQKIIHQADQRLAIDESRIYSENSGILNSFELQTGQLVWETYLGSDEVQWQASKSGPLLLVLPVALSDSRPFDVCFYNADDGRPVQKIRLHGQGKITAHQAAGVLLISTANQLCAFSRI